MRSPTSRQLGGIALVASAFISIAFAACNGTWSAGDVDGGGPDATIQPGHFHPDGYAVPEQHGHQFNFQTLPCATAACHGADLTGGASLVTCDACHTGATPASWRTTCTFCHGGTDNQTGAPPQQLDDGVGPGSFAPHTKHVTQGIAKAFDCTECHVKATDVLSPGHTVDATPGLAEVDMASGLSPQGVYAQQQCSNTYCHGNGRADNGTVAITAGPRDCQSCHPGMASDQTAWGTMSGLHALHLASATTITCGDCHNSVTTDGTTIAAPALHVDGTRQVTFSVGNFTFDANVQQCTGTCHNTDHQADLWQSANGRFHPLGWADQTQHGPEMELQRMNCRSCHAADLTGSTVGSLTAPSCDSCHTAGWRSNCVFCHGGNGGDTTGAPPRDLGAPLGTAAQSFVAHTKHMQTSLTANMDCTECHVKPVDVLSDNHAFDATPAKSEVNFAGGRAAGGNYNNAGTCTNNYCHGNGRAANGTVTDGAAAMTCKSCHPGMDSASADWLNMSGQHSLHLALGDETCGDCHGNVTTDGTQVISAALHINGSVSNQFAETVVYDAGTKTCTGACHGKTHNNTW